MRDEIKYIYDCNGEAIELDDIQRVRLVCFKCTEYIKDKFGILISPYNQFFSDEVYKNTTIYLCENCYKDIMVFCGSVAD